MKKLKLLLIVFICFVLNNHINAQTTVNLAAQCDCEVKKPGTEITPGATTPPGSNVGDLLVDASGDVFYWDGDSWEVSTAGGSTPWNNTDGTPATQSSTNINYINGNVGLGSTNPLSRLDVAGSIRTSHFYYSPSEDVYLRGGTMTGNVLLNDNGGNVGIGTNAPSAKLDINGTTRLRNLPAGLGTDQLVTTDGSGNLRKINVSTLNSINTDNQALSLSGTNLSISGGNAVNLAPLASAINTDDQTLSLSGTNLSITDGNSVNLAPLASAINTDDQTLSLSGTNLSIAGGNTISLSAIGADNLGNHTATTALNMNNKVINFGTTAQQMLNLYGAGYGIGVQGGTQYFRSNDHFAWFKGGIHNSATFNPGTGGTTMMVLNSSGDLGLGITTPTARLDIADGTRSGTHATNQTLYITGDLEPGNAGTENGNIEFRHNNGTQGIGFGYQGMYSTGSVANVPLNLSSKGTSHLVLNGHSYSTGNVGIGTTGPSAKLDVNGTTRLRNLPAGAGTDQIVTTDGSGNLRKINVSTLNSINTDNQTLSLSGTNLSIAGGNTISLSSIGADNLGNHTATTALNMNNKVINFGTTTQQMLNLYGAGYGIGVQGGTQYFRTGNHFAWYRGGVHSNTALASGTGGTAMMVLRDNGNLGIGTSNPAQKLDVAGNVELDGYLVMQGSKHALQGTDNWLRLNGASHFTNGVFTPGNLRADGAVTFNDLGADKDFRVESDGNAGMLFVDASTNRVGIGTTAPSNTLQVQGSSFLNGQITSAHSVWHRSSDNKDRLHYANNGSTYQRTYDDFIWRNSTGSNIMFMDGATGRLGINTSTPSANLHVNGTSRFENVMTIRTNMWHQSTDGKDRLYYGNNGNTFYKTANDHEWRNTSDVVRMKLEGGTGHLGINVSNPRYPLHLNVSNAKGIALLSDANGNNFHGFGVGNNEIEFYSGTSATGGPQMILTNAGTVGVGTTDPYYPLHIGYPSSGRKIALLADAQGANFHGFGISNARMEFFSGASLSDAPDMVITNANQVGIGTTNPTATLSVNGSANKTGGGSWATYSDRRVKKNIEVYTDGLEKVLQIQPKSFEYNGKGGYKADGKTYYGIIAQEMEEVAPYMVSKVETEDFKDQRQYDETALTYMLVNAVQEQQAQIEKLKAENNQLKTTNATLSAKMSELEILKAEIESIKAMLSSENPTPSVNKVSDK